MSKLVEKKGQKFVHQGDLLTAVSFFGESDKEYNTAKEAIDNNPPKGMIVVKNKEHGGYTELERSFLYEEKKQEDVESD